MALDIKQLQSYLETLLQKRNDIIVSNVTNDEKQVSLTLLDKENDELNQSIDIYFRLKDYNSLEDVYNKLNGKITLADLSPYAKTAELPAPVDLSPYAKTAELPAPLDLSPYAKTAELPAPVDLSPYAKTAELPAPVDLSPYAKTAELPAPVDLSPYAKTAELPAPVDLSPFLKKSRLSSGLVKGYIFPTLLNGFRNYSSSFSPASVFLYEDGSCHISGFLIGGLSHSPIFKLPPEFSPSHTFMGICYCASDTALGMYVQSDGIVKMSSPISRGQWFSFQITYRVSL